MAKPVCLIKKVARLKIFKLINWIFVWTRLTNIIVLHYYLKLILQQEAIFNQFL